LNEKWYIAWGSNVFCQFSDIIEYYERVLYDLLNTRNISQAQINRLKDIIYINKLKFERFSSDHFFEDIAIREKNGDLRLIVTQNVLAALIIKYRNIIPSNLEDNSELARFFYNMIKKQNNSKPTKIASLSKNIQQIQSDDRGYDGKLISGYKDQFTALVAYIKKNSK